ncbi:protein eyes shut [Cephus cinctus]|uniref:Protein eyes shut n=1 Tax=Cephus cinctus TaxID=211228 RepID=A0AAJ7CDU7_CEPCN|nr:protein eyes shut [Cephus cinctus]
MTRYYLVRRISLIVLTALTLAISSGLRCSNEPCMYGICLDDTNSSYSCYCIDGYTGINCDINWDDCWSNPCLNGGTCNDAVATYNCSCADGFVGVNCEQRFSECLNQPCLNNGTCLDYNGFVCQCPEGYSGDYCEIDASVCNNTICKNFGECIEGPGFLFTCRCTEGWTGELCEEDVNECENFPCQNGGLCLNIPASYTCACLFGFTGKDCDKTIVLCESNPCQNDAVCLLEDSQPVCYCVPDYHGSLCELRYNDCESKFAQCENGGTCIDGINNFTCACPVPYTGDMCDRYNPYAYSSTTQEVFITTKSSSTSGTTDFQEFQTTTGLEFPSTEPTVFTVTKDGVSLTSAVSVTDFTISERNATRVTEASTETSEKPVLTNFTIKPEDYAPGGKSSTDVTRSSYDSTKNIINDTESTITSTKAVSVDTTESTKKTTNTSSTSEIYTAFFPTIISFTESTVTTDFDRDNTTAVIRPTMLPEDTMGTSTMKTEDRSTVKDFITVFTETTLYDGTKRISDTDMSESTIVMSEKTPEITTHGITQFFTEAPSAVVTSKTRTEIPSTEPHIITSNVTERTTSAFVTTTDKLYSLTSDVMTSASETVEAETTTEKRVTIYNCTRQQCFNISLCINDSTECDCSYQDNCRTMPSITNAAFNGKSFVRQQFLVDGNGSLKIFARLKTLSKSGILVHAFFDDDRYILLYMQSGQLKFQFSCGLQTMLLGEIDSPINNGYDVDLEMRFQYIMDIKGDKCSARLLVNNTVAMSGEQIVSFQENIPHQGMLHLGGIPLAFSHYFPHIALGFVGCMSQLKVNDIQKHFMYDSVETYQLEECTSFLCLTSPCRNFGACKEVNGKIKCKCIAGYTGEMCEKSVCDDNPCQLGATCISSPGTGFLCVCPLGTHGLLCEEDIVIVQPSFSVFVPGFSSYVAYGLTGSIKDSMELKMRLIPQSIEQISLLAFMGQTGSHKELTDHLSLTYVRGYIMLTWDLGSGVRRIFTNSPLTAKVHRPHTVRIGRRGRDAWLSVDGLENVTGQSAGTMTRLDVSPILYIGGHKSRNFDTLPHDLPLHTGFSGCIFDIELRLENSLVPVSKTSPATGRGVGECHRNECTHRSCKNGGVCLNHGPTYSCVCMKDWEGPDCSVPAKMCSPSDEEY